MQLWPAHNIAFIPYTWTQQQCLSCLQKYCSFAVALQEQGKLHIGYTFRLRIGYTYRLHIGMTRPSSTALGYITAAL